MTTKTLYVYSDGDKTVFTPIEPPVYDQTIVRLIADDGMELVNGESVTTCIDTDNVSLWSERVATAPIEGEFA